MYYLEWGHNLACSTLPSTWNPLTDEKCPTKCSKRWCQLCHFYQLHKIVHKIQFVFYYLYCRITYVCFKINSYRIGKCEKVQLHMMFLWLYLRVLLWIFRQSTERRQPTSIDALLFLHDPKLWLHQSTSCALVQFEQTSSIHRNGQGPWVFHLDQSSLKMREWEDRSNTNYWFTVQNTWAQYL